MKKSILIIIAILLSSCNKNGEFPPRSYHIEIEISDANGRDLIEGIRYATASDYHSDYYPISDSDFNCTSKTDQIHVYNSSVNITKNPQIIRFDAGTSVGRPDFRPEVITIEMVCYHIFKDIEKHTLTTKWEYASSFGAGHCTSIILDGGTEYKSALIGKDGLEAYFAKIVHDE